MGLMEGNINRNVADIGMVYTSFATLFIIVVVFVSIMDSDNWDFEENQDESRTGQAYSQEHFETTVIDMIIFTYIVILSVHCFKKFKTICNISILVLTLIYIGNQISDPFTVEISLVIIGLILGMYHLKMEDQEVSATSTHIETLRDDIWEWLNSSNQHVFNANTNSENGEKLENAKCLNLNSLSDEEVVNQTQDLTALHKEENNTKAQLPPLLHILHEPPIPQCCRFTLAEIQLATHDFDDAFVIGKGGFGKVYKSFMDNKATTFAIKRLDPSSRQGSKEFWTEIHMLSQFRHAHLVSLIGYCNECNEMILVYEYMSKGSLADHLHLKEGRNVNCITLCWVERLKICIGASRGLEYLHTGTGLRQRVIHRDLKSSNILLDENWAAKISDFGLSKIGPANQSSTHVSTQVVGTRGYIDPDYLLTHRLTRKSDVYSFGVVLFEMLSGRQALDSRLPVAQRGLALWVQQCIREDKAYVLVDPNLKWEILPDSFKAFLKIGEQCLDSCPKKRPKMSEVVASLESALALQERIDSSLLDNNDDFNFGGTSNDKDKAGTSSVHLEVIDPGPRRMRWWAIGRVFKR